MTVSRRRKLLVLLAAVLTLAAACGDSSADVINTGSGVGDSAGKVDDPQVAAAPGDEPSLSFARVADSLVSHTAYRFESFVEIDLGPLGSMGSTTEPVGTGEARDGVVHSVTHLGVMLASGPLAPPELLDRRDELVMETYIDGTIMLVRAPFVAVMQDAGLGFFPRSVREMGDGWGLVRLDEVGGLSALNGGGPEMELLQPERLARLVAALRSPSGERSITLRGEEVTEVTGRLTMGELMDARGMDREELLNAMGSLPQGLGPGSADAVREVVTRLMQTPVNVTIAHDEQSRLRLLEVRLDLGRFMSDLMSEVGGDIGSGDSGPPDLEMVQVIRSEFFDYDSPDIEVEMPDTTDAVDITDSFDDLMAGVGVGL